MPKENLSAIAKRLREYALGLGAKGWVTLRPTTRTSLDQLFAFVEESYRAIAPKRVLDRL